MTFLEKLEGFALRWPVFLGILIADLLGMVFGWYYYWDVGQFDPSSTYYQPIWTWLLVSDSPNAVALFFAALILRKMGKRSKVLDALAIITNVYVGLWTTLLFNLYPENFGTYEWGSTNNILFITHLGMPLQALVLVHGSRVDRWAPLGLSLLAAFAALYLYVDYGPLLLHPAPFLHPEDGALHAGSPALMVLAIGAWLGLTKPWRQDQ